MRYAGSLCRLSLRSLFPRETHLLIVLSPSILLGLAAAVSKAGKSVTSKAAAQATDEYIAAAVMRGGTAAVLFVAVWLIQAERRPSVSAEFWVALVLNTVLLGLLAVLVQRAYKLADVSLVAPLLGLTPVMTILPSLLVTNETFTLVGVSGVCVTSLGGFVALSGGALSREALTESVQNRGVQLIAIVLLFVGFIGPLDKIGISQTSPLFWSMSINLTSGAVVAVLSGLYSDPLDGVSWNTVGVLAGLSVFNAGIWVGQAFAYELTNVAYVQSLKHGSILIAVLLGNRLYDEAALKSRLLGSALIVLGVGLLSVAI